MNKPYAIVSKIGAMRSTPAAIVAFTCLSLLVDNIAYSIAFAFLPHVFDDMKLASESQLGIVTTLYGVGTFITSIISGIVSDKMGRRKPLMLIGAVGYGISGIVLFFSHKFWHILVYKLVNGLASGCIYPLSIAIIGDVYPQKLLGLKMSFIQVFGNLGYMVGPLIGGALYDKVGVHGSATLLIERS
ncbi:major facilitator superfamily domain-containing protein [Kickxella alabastrina]|uniref:major facilitator superfamily domain-containing protein n=1 Tax=Kickxella alabastrina TaxID=61397 RepID=UPI002220E4CC|nr:major facilitator superfamily domain-containing protein [Kickxella alabastrina]KAI7832100.1 major facilitator superfamily domain-containing protein [Kickxella alabastrina]